MNPVTIWTCDPFFMIYNFLFSFVSAIRAELDDFAVMIQIFDFLQSNKAMPPVTSATNAKPV